MSSHSQPLRTLLLAIILISAAWLIKTYFEQPRTDPQPEAVRARPIHRVARETLPTIVEPNENWLNESRPNTVVEQPDVFHSPQLHELPEPSASAHDPAPMIR